MVTILNAPSTKPQAADPILRLLDSIQQIQLRFIDDAAGREAFEGLLAILLDLTDSEYGFIAEVLRQNDRPYLKARAITNIAWNEETRTLWARDSDDGLEFHNLSTLYGVVLKTGEPLVSDNPATDPRRGGLAVDHPPLNKFLGLPILHGEVLIGMIGLANRESGYDQHLIDYLDPIVTTCASIFRSIRADRNRDEAERKLLIYRERLESLVTERTNERDLSREQLVESERLAFMGTLTAGIAHQINNPTGAILAAAQFALSTTEEAKRNKFIVRHS
jgi:GAF domain-containing protein